MQYESESIVYLTDFKDGSLPTNPNIQASLLSFSEADETLTLNVTSTVPAAFVSLETPIAGHFSDNNFLLLPWQPRVLQFSMKQGSQVIEELFLDLLEIFSLADIGGQSPVQDCTLPSGDCSAELTAGDADNARSEEQVGAASVQIS